MNFFLVIVSVMSVISCSLLKLVNSFHWNLCLVAFCYIRTQIMSIQDTVLLIYAYRHSVMSKVYEFLFRISIDKSIPLPVRLELMKIIVANRVGCRKGLIAYI